MFGPSLPHWLDRATDPLHRKPKAHTQSRVIATNPLPVAMYINAVYYPNYRAFPECPPSSLRLDIISHVFYAFAAIGSDGTAYLSNAAVDDQMPIDETQGCLRAFAQLKGQYTHLKLILSFGGADSSAATWAEVAADSSKRTNFARSARILIDQYSFDGIDIDWEHPDTNQAADYIQLLSCLRNHFPAPRYILTTALPAGQWVLENIDLSQLAANIDLLNLMAYDFTGNWGDPKISGHHAQMFPIHGGGASQPGIDYLLSQGFPSNKILFGCPCYGWSFLNCNNVNQACDDCGGSGGAFDYKDLPRPGTQELVDEAPVAAFCIGGDGGFVTYDNPQTVATKANYAKSRGFAGMFFWHVLADAPGNRSLVYTSYTTLHS